MGLFRIQCGSPDIGLAHTLHRHNLKLTLSAKNFACYKTFLSIDKFTLKTKMVSPYVFQIFMYVHFLDHVLDNFAWLRERKNKKWIYDKPCLFQI